MAKTVDSQVRENGTWKNGKYYGRLGNEWFNVKDAWAKQNGVWTKVYGGLDYNPYEDFKADYSVDNTDGNLSFDNKNRVRFTDAERNDKAYLYKDFGVDYFGDFVIEFEAQIISASNSSVNIWMSLTNELMTDYDGTAGSSGWVFQDDSLHISTWSNFGTLWFYTRDRSDDTDDIWTTSWTNSTGTPIFYCRTYRSGTNWYVDYYKDPQRSILWDSTVIANCDTERKRYLFPISTLEFSGGGGEPQTSWVGNVRIIDRG